MRLAQTALLLAELDRLAWRDRREGEGGSHLPVIITGDFNSRPHSPTYRLLKYGQVRDETESFVLSKYLIIQVEYNNRPGAPSFLPPSLRVGGELNNHPKPRLRLRVVQTIVSLPRIPQTQWGLRRLDRGDV